MKMEIDVPPINVLQERLRTILRNSGIKEKSKAAKTMEFGFMQGVATVLGDNLPPYYTILLISGRSILDEK